MDSGSAERVRIEPTANRDAPQCIAHRGFAGVFPENTLAAMRKASHGTSAESVGGGTSGAPAADMVEIDVVPAAGGEPVVFHDLTLGRVTDVSADRRRQPVWETPVEKLRELSILGSDETVPTLAELVAVVPPAVGVNLELKHPGTGQPRRELDVPERGRERWIGFAERVVSVLRNNENPVLVSSSYEGALAAMRAVAPEIPLAYLFWNSIEGGLDITRRYDCEAVNPPMDMVRDTDLFNAGDIPTGPFADIDLVERAHDAGRTVNVWTIQTGRQATQLRAAGVDGLITDYPCVDSADDERQPSESTSRTIGSGMPMAGR